MIWCCGSRRHHRCPRTSSDAGPTYPMKPYPFNAATLRPTAQTLRPARVNPFAGQARQHSWWDTGLLGFGPLMFRRIVVTLAIVMLALGVYASGVWSAGDVESVAGQIQSGHLDVQFELDEVWQHAVDFDRHRSDGGWNARWSLYFRGDSIHDYDDHLTIKVWEHEDGRTPSDDDARDLGANATMSHGVAGRSCRLRLDERSEERRERARSAATSESNRKRQNWHRRAKATMTVCEGYYGQRELHEIYFSRGKKVIYIRMLASEINQAGPAMALAESVYSED